MLCWGAESQWLDLEEMSLPRDTRFVSIETGARHTCGLLEDGTAVCRGDDDHVQSSPPEDQQFISLSSGTYHTCGLREDGKAVCWGENQVPSSIELPEAYGLTLPPLDERFRSLSSGRAHTCGLRMDGSAVCWGLDDRRVLYGHGQASPPRHERFASISSGGRHTCGLRADGTAVCWPTWGRSSLSEGLDFVRADRAITVPGLDEKYIAITAGASHSCALTVDGTPYCWGANDLGQLAAPLGEEFISISSLRNTTCGQRADGSVLCWGGDVRETWAPRPHETFRLVTAIAGLRTDGTVAWWNEGPERYTPSEAFGSIIAAAAAPASVCGVREDGSIKCWTSRGETLSPLLNSRITALSQYVDFGCGLLESGRPYCWDHSVNDLRWPKPPKGEILTAITAGAEFACGLRQDGSAVCWGDDRWDKTNSPANLRFTSIASRAGHTCGVVTDGTLACWGLNNHGQSTPPVRCAMEIERLSW